MTDKNCNCCGAEMNSKVKGRFGRCRECQKGNHSPNCFGPELNPEERESWKDKLENLLVPRKKSYENWFADKIFWQRKALES